jgi:HEPN domain-containing protein
LIAKGGNIQREMVYTRYPLKVAGKWVTPDEYYTQEKTRVVIDDAKFVVDVIKTILKE